MGKYSNFKRNKHDKYMTTQEGVDPLLQYLSELPPVKFFEPCAADYGLCKKLKRAGHICAGASDIKPESGWVKKHDALTLTKKQLNGARRIITNPPWTRNLMHPMIKHFSDMVPTWLLFDADWMHTKQAIPYLPRLQTIISVGRIRWIPGSDHDGKENCCWYLFNKNNPNEKTEFVGRYD